MENKDSIKNKSDNEEVDFEPLIAWFVGGLQKIGRFFNLVVSALVNRWILILGVTLIGLIAGLGVYFLADKKYSASVQLIANHTTNQISKNIIESLTRLTVDKSHNNLKTALNISQEQAEEISAILYLDHNFEVPSNEDTVAEGKPFFIYIETYSPEVLNDAQEALINYLEFQPLTTELRSRDEVEITSKIKKHEIELQRLDSLKGIVAKSIEPRSGGNGFIYGEPINPIEVYKESERIFDEYLTLKSRLKTLRSIKMISEFSPSEKPIFPRLRHILFFAGGFFLLGLILGIRVESKDHSAA